MEHADMLRITDLTEIALKELVAAGSVQPKQIIVIGTSTSEVAGHHIGTSGMSEVAERIFAGIKRVQASSEFYIAFQCCEHLNRALVIEERLLGDYPMLEQVSVIPMPKAGGSMAAYAYRHLEKPIVVETIRAHAGMDIGSTLIGMHLKHVAVPYRSSVRMIGQAPVTMAYTRPKLIGGSRAIYETNDSVTASEHTTVSDSCL